MILESVASVITWELRNANFQTPPQIYWIRNSCRWGSQQTGVTGDSYSLTGTLRSDYHWSVGQRQQSRAGRQPRQNPETNSEMRESCLHDRQHSVSGQTGRLTAAMKSKESVMEKIVPRRSTKSQARWPGNLGWAWLCLSPAVWPWMWPVSSQPVSSLKCFAERALPFRSVSLYLVWDSFLPSLTPNTSPPHPQPRPYSPTSLRK